MRNRQVAEIIARRRNGQLAERLAWPLNGEDASPIAAENGIAAPSARIARERLNPQSTVAQMMWRYYHDQQAMSADQGRALWYAIQPVLRLIGDMAIGGIGQPTIGAYVVNRLMEGVSNATARRELANLRSALNAAATAGEIDAPGTLIIPSSGPPRSEVVSPDGIRHLLAEARSDQRLYIFVLLAIATGGRIGAIMGLTWGRIDLNRRIVDLRYYGQRAARRKGRAVTPMSQAVADRLEPLHPGSDGPVFAIGPSSMRKIFRAACRRAGLPDTIVPHTLRHTAATSMLLEVPIIVASKMLGHSSIQTTERVYAHVMAEHLRPAADVIGRLLPKEDIENGDI